MPPCDAMFSQVGVALDDVDDVEQVVVAGASRIGVTPAWLI